MKISRLFAMVTVLLAATAVNVMAQNLVKGKVVDKSGQPIIGAAVYLVENPSKGAVTDLNGAWSLEVDPGSTLHFSSIGYRDQDVKPGNQTVLNVILEEDVSLLEEVVVVGYGTQKKVNMTGAVSAVNVDDKMTGRSLSNVSTGLSGLVPGLQVTNTTSMAGKDGASLMIRGLGTVNTATPLVVVDGMPDVDINRINFADVESISVLKDAASASVYGSPLPTASS
jgi:outer membrane receptor protein involved in Fe transport